MPVVGRCECSVQDLKQWRLCEMTVSVQTKNIIYPEPHMFSVSVAFILTPVGVARPQSFAWVWVDFVACHVQRRFIWPHTCTHPGIIGTRHKATVMHVHWLQPMRHNWMKPPSNVVCYPVLHLQYLRGSSNRHLEHWDILWTVIRASGHFKEQTAFYN